MSDVHPDGALPGTPAALAGSSGIVVLERYGQRYQLDYEKALFCAENLPGFRIVEGLCTVCIPAAWYAWLVGEDKPYRKLMLKPADPFDEALDGMVRAAQSRDSAGE